MKELEASAVRGLLLLASLEFWSGEEKKIEGKKQRNILGYVDKARFEPAQ